MPGTTDSVGCHDRGASSPPSSERLADLLAEANYFHEVLLRRPATTSVVTAYVDAHESLGISETPGERRSVRIIVERRLDPEAIEFATRRSASSLLRAKLKILAYCIEIDPRSLEDMVNDRRSRVAAWTRLVAETIRTPSVLFRGLYQIRRHGLV